MAPRIRLSLSKPLPTIRETHEEAMEDSSSNPKRTGSAAASSDSYSSDDYIQSICHLARPTFLGLPESSHKDQDRKTLKTIEDMSWSPSLGRMQQEMSKCKLTNLISNVVPLGKVVPAETEFWSREDPLAQIYTHAGRLCSSKASLYTKNSSTGYSQCNSSTPNSELHPPIMKEKATGKPTFPRVFSFPRLPSPRPAQKESTCSELKYLRKDEGTVLGSSHSQKENGPVFINGEELSPSSARGKLVGNPALHWSVRSCLFNTTGTNEQEGRETSHCDNKNVVGDVPTKQRYSECFRVPKKAMIRNWISEHRCIWKEAKVKACLLPAIAEV
ncbi:uncharacterized protein LOC115615698 [Strigops habroptila]|uniref:uncharacterized protein LOC115615698 n=1 Tax=Strigops habroptila TaxID=2489341 RepID=UPI0011CF4FBC|nr:uncharacterized protein LOC115615698 [Strigops habroptila]XP_030360037.1 uncharacterized protein LOC115615698 [Strigops habroptila]